MQSNRIRKICNYRYVWLNRVNYLLFIIVVVCVFFFVTAHYTNCNWVRVRVQIIIHIDICDGEISAQRGAFGHGQPQKHNEQRVDYTKTI